MISLEFELNGQPVGVTADPKSPLLDILRGNFNIQSTKGGCAPQGLCGCCTVLINKQPRLSCTLPIKSVAGKSVSTLEGVPDADKQALASALCASGGAQCGYCTPGIVLSCHALLAQNPHPERQDILKALNQHLCRCTGYTAIVEGVLSVGQRPGPGIRPEGQEIILGDRAFVGDLTRPGSLVGRVLFASSESWPARVLKIALPAIPEIHFSVLQPEGSLLAHPGIVVVAAAGKEEAAVLAALKQVVIEVSAEAATPQQVAVGRRREEAQTLLNTTIKSKLTLPFTDPVALEPESTLAVPTATGLVIYSAAQELSGVLKAAPGASVRLVPSGGSYGGRLGGEVERAAARLADATKRPIQLGLSMEEGMRVHGKRPAAEVSVEAGADAEGNLAKLVIQVRVKGGLHSEDADRVVAYALGAIPYLCPDLQVEVLVEEGIEPLWTAGTLRGAGTLPVALGVEQAITMLATQLNQDAFAFRKRALPEEGQAVLGALEAAWALEGANKGLGLCRVDGAGGVRVWLRREGWDRIEVFCSVPELGQGRDQRLLQALAEETGLDPSSFSFPWGESEIIHGGCTEPGAAVEEAAHQAASRLKAAKPGEVVMGEGGMGAPGWAAALAVLEEEAVTRVYLSAASCGDELLTKNLLEGAAHMGAGISLSEEVAILGGQTENRLRMLGVIKPKGCPEFLAASVPLPGVARDVSEPGIAAAAAAIVGAVAGKSPEIRLPLRDSPAAKKAGARPGSR